MAQRSHFNPSLFTRLYLYSQMRMPGLWLAAGRGGVLTSLRVLRAGQTCWESDEMYAMGPVARTPAARTPRDPQPKRQLGRRAARVLPTNTSGPGSRITSAYIERTT